MAPGRHSLSCASVERKSLPCLAFERMGNYYLLGKVTVNQVMTRKERIVTKDTPLEETARIMVDNKIGGLPVLCEGKIVGKITKTDLFKIFIELVGHVRKGGV
jgi:CBS domain-containing protein